jgi:hypothetical protein
MLAEIKASDARFHQVRAFAVDLHGAVFQDSADGAATASVEVCRDGTWDHPWYGRITIEPGLRAAFLQNFERQVRKSPELPIDYDHMPGPAAGWIVALRNEADRMVADCRWTPEGRRRIRDGEYRYFSPEWDTDYTDAETGVHYGPTLYGGGLTNKPFFKGLEAVRASEPAATGRVEKEPIVPNDTKPAADSAPTSPPGESPQILQLSERLAALEAENAALRARDTRRALEQTFAEIRISGCRLAPASRKALCDVAVKCSQEVREELVKALADVQTVELGERGFAEAADSAPAIPAAVERRLQEQARTTGLSLESLKQSYHEVLARRAERRPDLEA